MYQTTIALALANTSKGTKSDWMHFSNSHLPSSQGKKSVTLQSTVLLDQGSALSS